MEEITIHFNQLAQYNAKSTQIKSIIKTEFGLTKFDFAKSCWCIKSGDDIKVVRLTDASGMKTAGLKIIGHNDLALALLGFVKDWDITVESVIPESPIKLKQKVEVDKFRRWIVNQIRLGKISRQDGDKLIRRWCVTVTTEQQKIEVNNE